MLPRKSRVRKEIWLFQFSTAEKALTIMGKTIGKVLSHKQGHRTV